MKLTASLLTFLLLSACASQLPKFTKEEKGMAYIRNKQGQTIAKADPQEAKILLFEGGNYEDASSILFGALLSSEKRHQALLDECIGRGKKVPPIVKPSAKPKALTPVKPSAAKAKPKK